MEYGNELHEFDPFFNFRATEYMVENGFSEYFNWHDKKSWYPTGRDISATSQTMLHITTATTYQIFGGNSNLYDFTIILYSGEISDIYFLSNNSSDPINCVMKSAPKPLFP